MADTAEEHKKSTWSRLNLMVPSNLEGIVYIQVNITTVQCQCQCNMRFSQVTIQVDNELNQS